MGQDEFSRIDQVWWRCCCVGSEVASSNGVAVTTSSVTRTLEVSARPPPPPRLQTDRILEPPWTTCESRGVPVEDYHHSNQRA